MTLWRKVVSMESERCRLEVYCKLFLEDDDTMNSPTHPRSEPTWYAERSSLKKGVSTRYQVSMRNVQHG